MNEQSRAVVNFSTTILGAGVVILAMRSLAHLIGLNPGTELLQPANQNLIVQTRLKQLITHYHTIDDLRNIANYTGIIKLYHGAPIEYAEFLVAHGPKVPYRVEDTARYVAQVYGIPWMEFRQYAYRSHEVVTKLSTSVAPIAARWAWAFPLGEVLTDLNAHARMVSSARVLARQKNTKLEDAMEELYEQGFAIAKQREIIGTFDNVPDMLNIPDKLVLKSKSGALVELTVDGRAIPKNASVDAQHHLKIYESGEWTKKQLIEVWNNSYIDIKVAPRNIKSAKIVIRNMQPWEEELVEQAIKEHVAQFFIHTT